MDMEENARGAIGKQIYQSRAPSVTGRGKPHRSRKGEYEAWRRQRKHVEIKKLGGLAAMPPPPVGSSLDVFQIAKRRFELRVITLRYYLPSNWRQQTNAPNGLLIILLLRLIVCYQLIVSQFPCFRCLKAQNPNRYSNIPTCHW